MNNNMDLHAPVFLEAQEKLFRKFMEGRLRNGEPLKESVLAQEFGVNRRAMREAVHRNLYVMVNSAAMNGMSSDTRVERITPPWELAVLGTEIASGILAGCCLVMVCLSWVFWYKKQKNKNWKVER